MISPMAGASQAPPPDGRWRVLRSRGRPTTTSRHSSAWAAPPRSFRGAPVCSCPNTSTSPASSIAGRSRQYQPGVNTHAPVRYPARGRAERLAAARYARFQEFAPLRHPLPHELCYLPYGRTLPCLRHTPCPTIPSTRFVQLMTSTTCRSRYESYSIRCRATSPRRWWRSASTMPCESAIDSTPASALIADAWSAIAARAMSSARDEATH